MPELPPTYTPTDALPVQPPEIPATPIPAYAADVDDAAIFVAIEDTVKFGETNDGIRAKASQLGIDAEEVIRYTTGKDAQPLRILQWTAMSEETQRLTVETLETMGVRKTQPRNDLKVTVAHQQGDVDVPLQYQFRRFRVGGINESVSYREANPNHPSLTFVLHRTEDNRMWLQLVYGTNKDVARYKGNITRNPSDTFWVDESDTVHVLQAWEVSRGGLDQITSEDTIDFYIQGVEQFNERNRKTKGFIPIHALGEQIGDGLRLTLSMARYVQYEDKDRMPIPTFETLEARAHILTLMDELGEDHALDFLLASISDKRTQMNEYPTYGKNQRPLPWQNVMDRLSCWEVQIHDLRARQRGYFRWISAAELLRTETPAVAKSLEGNVKILRSMTAASLGMLGQVVGQDLLTTSEYNQNDIFILMDQMRLGAILERAHIDVDFEGRRMIIEGMRAGLIQMLDDGRAFRIGHQAAPMLIEKILVAMQQGVDQRTEELYQHVLDQAQAAQETGSDMVLDANAISNPTIIGALTTGGN